MSEPLSSSPEDSSESSPASPPPASSSSPKKRKEYKNSIPYIPKKMKYQLKEKTKREIEIEKEKTKREQEKTKQLQLTLKPTSNLSTHMLVFIFQKKTNNTLLLSMKWSSRTGLPIARLMMVY
ncbi:hypothetical protein FDP41_011777 [Naegleria fowleri]|uniref:Uncharacterized protein n=1 Tax=Naegleria fowleri TaxID=5763 RepID=A0A6A5C2J5_NAEFO|nr:uncharacterized protein FDP41_011777 [Naegleria fowleri]KAF0981916.1 hypothetical protein FDP41_011777 [Naegleria fowleri]